MESSIRFGLRNLPFLDYALKKTSLSSKNWCLIGLYSNLKKKVVDYFMQNKLIVITMFDVKEVKHHSIKYSPANIHVSSSKYSVW